MGGGVYTSSHWGFFGVFDYQLTVGLFLGCLGGLWEFGLGGLN